MALGLLINCSLTALINVVGHNRFLNFYGEPCARLERDVSVYGDALFPRTFLLRSVSLFLFSAPDVHLTSLQKMWVDKNLDMRVWKDMMNKFSSEWQALVIYVSTLDFSPRLLSACSLYIIIVNNHVECKPGFSGNPICRQRSPIEVVGPNFQLRFDNRQSCMYDHGLTAYEAEWDKNPRIVFHRSEFEQLAPKSL
jgi:hypothetical protein